MAPTRRFRHRPLSVITVTCALGLCPALARCQQLVYIALGDSVAYGTGGATPGGYVPRYASWLSGVDHSTVTGQDLGVPGETSSSILGSQLTNFYNTVASDNTAGDTITTISVQIGGNDFLNYVEGSLPSLTQFNMQWPTIVQQVKTNYTTLLTDIRSKVPSCDLILNGYYQITAFGSTIQQESDIANNSFATIAQQLAPTYGGRYVDNYDPFLGNNATFISGDGIHPNDSGYIQIATDMRFATPGPDSLVTFAAGLIPLCLHARRRMASRRDAPA